MARVSSDDGFVGDTTLKGAGPNHVRNLPSGLPSVGILDFAPAPLPSTAAPPRTPHRRTPGRILREWQEFRAVWRSPVPSASALSVGLDVAEQGSVASSPVTQYPSDTAGGPDDVVDQVIVDEFAFPATIEKSEAGSDEKCPPNEQLDEDPENLSEATGRSHAQTSLLLPIDVFRRTVWHALTAFYAPRFADPALERAYARETWSFAKPLALTSAIFLLINMALTIAMSPRPYVLADYIFLYGLSAPLTLLPILLIFVNMPARRPFLYQTLLGVSTWMWAFYQLLFLTFCGLYTKKFQLWGDCGGRDFIGLFYWACALPTIGLFGLKMNRLTQSIASIVFIILMCVLVTPYRKTWTRNVLNFAAFNAFVLYTHYVREQSERRLFILRTRLDSQFKRMRQAQVNERAAADSKRRLTSYVFHEVRVPLNTALLAAQNVRASLGAHARAYQIEFSALDGSLNQMSAVLNDILDFNRMDSGKFAFVARPFALHTSMRALFLPLKLSAEARQLTLVTELDPAVDIVGRVGRTSCGDPLCDETGEVGVFVGDEQRLRQVVTNLASNACKFTPPGGQVKITTRLLGPLSALSGRPMSAQSATTYKTEGARPSTPFSQVATDQEAAVVRIEVTDTGVGMCRHDVVESKLFSSFSQTEQGRLQGGKGTGLGLAIVRRIVQLSGGRLSVRSQVGVGTTFSVDLPLRLCKPGPSSPFDPALPAITGRRPSHQSVYTTSPPSSASASQAKGLADPLLSPPAMHGMHASGQLISLARQHSSSPDEDPGGHPPWSPGSEELHKEDSSATEPGKRLFDEGLRVLVVDDDNMTRMLMKRLLSRLGCVVETAENGQVAVDALYGDDAPVPPTPSTESGQSSSGLHPRVPSFSHGDLRFAVVFLDNQMPVMSGLDAVRRVRARGGRDFIVGVTGNALLTDQQEFLSAGADHVLIKPVYERDLKRMLVLADRYRRESIAKHPP